jgi:hypothetical protein
VKIRSQNFIHVALEGGGGIAKSKKHNQKLKRVFMCAEANLRNVSLFHADFVVT